MKRIGFSLCVTLLTFTIGVIVQYSAAWIFSTRAPVQRTTQSKPMSTIASSDEVQIKLLRVYRESDEGLTADFEVINGSTETLLYWGYEETHNASWSVRRSNRSQTYFPFCGTGIQRFQLSPSESARFTVRFIEAGVVQVGFDFATEDNGPRETIWSGDLLISTD